MEAAISVECDITLRTLALVKTSIWFWEKPEIQNEIRLHFSTEDPWKQQTWHKITERVLNLVDSSNIIWNILPELKDGVLNIGVKLYHWFSYIHWDLRLRVSDGRKIFWTPLGLVDEIKVFKHVWRKDPSLYIGYPMKPIFRIACMLAQKSFIKKHQREIIEDLKKLSLLANLKLVDLEVINCSDKVYGIISTYLSYYIHEDLRKKRKDYYDFENEDYIHLLEQKEESLFDELDSENILRNNLNESVTVGTVASPSIMVELSAWAGLTHAVKYYYKELRNFEIPIASNKIEQYCIELERDNIINPTYYRALKLTEILAFVYTKSNLHACEDAMLSETEYSKLDELFHFCPSESVVLPRFNKWINKVDSDLEEIFEHIACHVVNDHEAGLPIKRNLFQKLLNEIWVKASKSKIQNFKSLIINRFIRFSNRTDHDFTTLKRIFTKCDPINYKRYVLHTFRYIRYYWHPNLDTPSNFDLEKRFFSLMFSSTEDRNIFFTEEFYLSILLEHRRFDAWEKYYSDLNFFNAPLRDVIDPLRCLFTLGRKSHDPIKSWDKFIKWWLESEEDNTYLKVRFKESSYLSEIIYNFWLDDRFRGPDSYSSALLKWLFGSDDAIVQFKKEKLSILGLLDASFVQLEDGFFLPRKNIFHEEIHNFIKFCKITPECVNRAKEEISKKIEEIMLTHSSVVENIPALNFLMDWVSTSEKDKKAIFRKLNDSSVMFKLCENILGSDVKKVEDKFEDGESEFDITRTFYNVWLKLSGNVSEIKSYVMSLYDGEKSEDFISKLSSMYEKIERGKVLNIEDIIFDE